MLRSFPLLVLSLIFYSLLVFTIGGGDGQVFSNELMTPTLLSGAVWSLTWGDIMVIISLGLLFLEIVRAARSDASTIINHALSMIVFIVALVMFISGKPFATTTFFLITVMAALDVVAGFTISIRSARRDFGGGFGG